MTEAEVGLRARGTEADGLRHRIRAIPTEVVVTRLPRPGVANLDHITPLPKSALVERAGRLSGEQLAALCSAARFAIGCRPGVAVVAARRPGGSVGRASAVRLW